MATLHLIIKGKVQGVFYRAWAKEAAEQLGLTGWVKNTDEGNVEALVSGPDERVQQFTDACRQGPSRAQVTAIESQPVPDQAFACFQVIR
ncbi:acylphosphatase [Paraflavisolibacter sp. H34]|uniref:acylphosphatase n=1 Tax=Huijunlia imazamoxiresistens TaxID=3127457 RepID=UPI003016BD0A